MYILKTYPFFEFDILVWDGMLLILKCSYCPCWLFELIVQRSFFAFDFQTLLGFLSNFAFTLLMYSFCGLRYICLCFDLKERTRQSNRESGSRFKRTLT